MANEKRLIDANALIKDIDNYYNNSPFPHPGTTWLRGLELAVGLLLKAPTVVAYTEEQVDSIIQKADLLEIENRNLEQEVDWLKNCLNCEIRKDCPRHCGKIVHGCDPWEYGDNAVEVVHGRCWLCEDYDRFVETVCYLPDDNGGSTTIPINYCPNCGAKMRERKCDET